MIKLLKSLTAILSINSFALPLTNITTLHISKESDSQTPRILSLDDYIADALYSDFKLHYPSVYIKNLNVTSEDLDYSNEFVTPKSTFQIKDSQTGIYFGTAIFQNPTDVEQTFTTPEFVQKVTTSYTYQTVTGISGGSEVKYDFLGFNYKINYSETDTESISTTLTLTSPSQSITVAPHTESTVKVYLAAEQGNAYLNLAADISGTATCEINEIDGVGISYKADIVDAFKTLQETSTLPPEISILNNDGKIHFNGLGIIEGFVTKTNYYLQIKDRPIE